MTNGETWLAEVVSDIVLSCFTCLMEVSQEVDKSSILLETIGRKQIVNSLF